MDFSWATEYPDIHKLCTLFQLTELNNPVKFSYTPLPCILQNGPQCGLVALVMCLQTLKESLRDRNHEQFVNELFELAKSKNYTYNGEIFSASYMSQLAKHYLGPNHVKLHSGSLNTDEIKNFILNDGFILIPYDSDKDNSPALQNGHKAHWAAISGGVQTVTDFYVLSRHGKAKNIGIWNLNSLSESNSQLNEFSPDRKLHNVEYKLPDGGINGEIGLNNRAVLIKYENN